MSQTSLEDASSVEFAEPGDDEFAVPLRRGTSDEEPSAREPSPASSRLSYDEYEEEEGPSPGDEKRRRGSASSPRRVVSLLQRWRDWQRAARIAAASGDADSSKGSKETRQGKRAPAKTGTGDSGPDASATGTGLIRQRIARDMEAEILLEETYDERKAESEARETVERRGQLERTRAVLRRYRSACAAEDLKRRETENWVRYTTRDGLPYPGSLPEMNTFLLLWSTKDEEASMDTVEEMCRVVLHLLRNIDRILRFSGPVPEEYAAECELISGKLRIMLQRWIDLACYRLLRNIEANMVWEDANTTRYVLKTNNGVVCCIWAPIPLPVRHKRRATDRDRASVAVQRKHVAVEFEEIHLTVELPGDLDCHRMAIRALWLGHDHCSVEASSFTMPSLPQGLWNPPLDLLRFAQQEHEEKTRIRAEQAEERHLRLEEKKAILEKIQNPPASARSNKGRRLARKKQKKNQSAGSKLSDADLPMASVLPTAADLLPYLPTPDEIVQQREEEARAETRKQLFTRCEKNEVNLRKYRILGGVYRVDLLHQPPQPKDLGKETSLTTLELPKEPKFVPFFRPYRPPQPAPDAERTPEVVEAEMQALEAAMEKLVLITLKLPESVLWLEPPLVAHWIPEKSTWSTEHVHDVKFNEEKQTIAFRSGRLGVHGLAGYKFANLPFQSWELKPETSKTAGDQTPGVILVVTAAIVQAEFVVREDRACLRSLTGAATAPLGEILGEYSELESLIEQLRQAGCDLFPDRDAASYLQGIPTKHPVAEGHLRECMALLSTSYTFSWSRWNAARDFRQIVLQFKEMHGCVARQRTNVTLLVTPLKTTRIMCTEVSPEFSELPLDDEDQQFYADLYQLAWHTAGIKTRLLMEQVSHRLASTVARLLERTGVLSFSA